jgi:hypothetical protein
VVAALITRLCDWLTMSVCLITEVLWDLLCFGCNLLIFHVIVMVMVYAVNWSLLAELYFVFLICHSIISVLCCAGTVCDKQCGSWK